MTHPRKTTGRKVFGGIVIVVGALLAVCSILFFIAFGTGERGAARTAWQGCLAGVTAVIFGTGIFASRPEPGARASQPGAARVPGTRPSPANTALEGMISQSEDVGELELLPDDEIVEALSQAGLPTGEVSKMRRQTRDALVATTDAGIFSVAHALAGSLHELISDDALLDVRRSLTCP